MDDKKVTFAQSGISSDPGSGITIVSYTPETSGTPTVNLNYAALTPGTEVGGFNNYEVIQIDAIPPSGYTFVQWTGSASEWTFDSATSKSTKVHINNKAGTLTANFNLVDNTAPTLTKGLSGTAGLGGWYTSDVVVTLTGGDTGGSGLASVKYNLNSGGWTTYTAPFTISTEGTNTLAHRVTDNAGNVYVLTSQEIKIDKTLPVVTIIAPGAGSEYTLKQAVLADWSATDAVSGLASAVGTFPSGSAIDTSTVGTKTFMVTAIDNAGNEKTVTVDYSVIYKFTGFFRPVDNLGVLNVAKAGSAIPVKFSLSGNQGLNIFVLGYPKSQKIDLEYVPIVDTIEETVNAGNSSLSYDAAADQYIYVWKTEKVWAGTYRQLIVKLKDGEEYTANFNFKK